MMKLLAIHVLRILRPVLSLFACMAILAACSVESAPKIDQTDMRFAAFYSDYLLQSGITEQNGSQEPLTISSSEVDSLFMKHGLTREAFDKKLQLYGREPELWRDVLVQVRKNLRKGRP